jgi:hypothetical protein
MTSPTQTNINILNNTCLRTPPIDSKIPHLFFTNKSTYVHSDMIFQKKTIQTFFFKTIDFFHGLMSSTYHFKKTPNKTTRLHNI